MKQLFTIIVTALITAGLLVGWFAVLQWGWVGDYTNLNLFSFGADETRPTVLDLDDMPRGKLIWDDLWGDNDAANAQQWTANTWVFCNENQNPITDKITGEVICVDADVVETECIWLDGDVYDLWDTKTQYRPIILGDDENDDQYQDCQSAEFVCVNGLYVSDTEDALRYNRAECITIDITEQEEITCEFDGELYLPGEAVYQYLKPKVEKTTECEYVGFYCNGQGNRWSNFDEDVWNREKCYFTESFDDKYIDEYADQLITQWVLEKNEFWELTVKETTFEIQSEGESCTTPWWKSVNHGKSVLSFEEETGWFEEECVIRTSECVDGEWQKFDPYDYPSCKNNVPDSCFINGFELYHDTTRELYKVGSYVNGSRECDSKEIRCEDGELMWDEWYIYTTCTPPVARTAPRAAAPVYDASKASCPSPYIGWGASWSANQTGIGYTTATVPFGTECKAVNLVCMFGSIRVWSVSSYGSPVWSNYYASCSAGNPTGCTSACGSVAHGGTLTTYNFASLPYDPSVASCNGVANATTVSTCSNGTLSPAPAANCSCTVQWPANCANGMTHGQTITRKNDPGCSADQFGNELDWWANTACQCKYGSITCTNGNLSKTANYPGDGFPQGACS